MSARGFLGLPPSLQQMIIEGLDAEVANAQRRLVQVEGGNEQDEEMAQALRDDISHTNALRETLTSGRA